MGVGTAVKPHDLHGQLGALTRSHLTAVDITRVEYECRAITVSPQRSATAEFKHGWLPKPACLPP